MIGVLLRKEWGIYMKKNNDEYRAKKTALGMRKLHELLTTDEFRWMEVDTKEDSKVIKHTVYVYK